MTKKTKKLFKGTMYSKKFKIVSFLVLLIIGELFFLYLGGFYPNPNTPIASREEPVSVSSPASSFEMEFYAPVDAEYNILFKPFRTDNLTSDNHKAIIASPVFDTLSKINIQSKSKHIEFASENSLNHDFKMYLLDWYAVIGKTSLTKGQYKVHIFWEKVPESFSGYIQIIPSRWNVEMKQKISTWGMISLPFVLLLIMEVRKRQNQ